MAKSIAADTPAVIPGWVAEEFGRFEQGLNGSSGDAIHASRRAAFKNFTAAGFPTPRDESWKYTNLAPVLGGGYALAGPADAAQETALDLGGPRIVVVNGRIAAPVTPASLPAGIEIAPLEDAISGLAPASLVEAARKHFGKHAAADGDPLVALNASFLRGGVLVRVPKGAAPEEPLSIAFVTAGGAKDAPVISFPRLLVVAEEGSHLAVVERHVGSAGGRYFSAGVTEIVAGPSARVDHYKLVEEAADAANVGTVAFEAGRGAHARTHALTFGGKLVRNQLCMALKGEGAYALLNGLTVVSSSQHVDNDTIIDHTEPHCESHELYKGIYGGAAEGVFSGTIIVQPGAQKTNAYQSNQSILLTDEASVNSRPQLKIWADDVKCTHGATVGQLDEDALFYIRSRGIGAADARNLLIHAFAGEVIDGVLSPLREHLESLLMAKLAA